ncbi:DUF3320 domain-containing protein [Kitasatospora viridis]|nr:DUF3320 domain-containing protein [Kitasatospora viridis]
MSSPARSGADDPGLDRLKVVLSGWRNSLLDMGGRNRLLNFRHTKTASLELTSPVAATVLRGLAKGFEFAAVTAQDQPALLGALPSEARELVTQKPTQAALDSALVALSGKSRQMFNDYGLWVLWLGVGILDWREDGAQQSSSAPLLLVPVELRRDAGGRTRLHLKTDQEWIHNPALAVKLERLGVDWTRVTGAEASDLGTVLAAARAVAASRDGWSVAERVVLGLFASYKESMYQDLLQNERRILAHPLVRAVGLGPESGLPADLIDFEPPDTERIDELQLPERTPLVLDADASQRQCVAAALDRRSFVMSGPPGTGKSQTIANMIAALIQDGRSVLFVSEKAAALDVVRNRLRDVGLNDFVLALHSGDTTKRAVATELARVLTTEARVTGAAEHELDRARRLREELSAYAAAMNQVREPLGRSLHDVLGRLALLDQAETPAVLLDSRRNTPAIRALAAGQLRELVDAGRNISRAWRPVCEGEAFVWRGLSGDSGLTVAEQAVDALAGLRTAVERRPFAGFRVEPATTDAVLQYVRTVRAGLPGRPTSADTVLADDCTVLLGQLAGLFGISDPTTPDSAFELLELADLTAAPHRPPAAWLTPARCREVARATTELRQALVAESAAREAAALTFGDQVLRAAELPELVRRFTEEYQGWQWPLKKQLKSDRKAAAALTHRGTWEKQLGGRLTDALSWQVAAAEVVRLADQHAELLGSYTPRNEAGLASLEEALETTLRIVELTDENTDRRALAALLADGAEPGEAVALLADGARTALAHWCDATEHRARLWTESAEVLRRLFEAPRDAQLRIELSTSLDRARTLLGELTADPQGPQEWRAYQDAMAVLVQHGAEQLVIRAAERGVAAGQLPEVLEQAVLKAWADDVLATDARLRTTRSADLDSRVSDFQEADRRLVAAAAGAVVEACNRRRPRSLVGGAAAVIVRQAELKTRHMPVRDLLGRTRDVVRSIKPCFMMSPLTVSQFLPADYEFDVVIFDEASQVRPGDAINCIYRGRAVVVAGDAKQLPPTSFFDSSVEDEGEEYSEELPDSFESLLDACKAGTMRELPLRWHYRSRHENLIAFSNHSFYRNSMVTFPGALDEGNDVGVAFLRADGVYDRGGRRDNRIEARFVADRVIHHFDTRPRRSLGVVALSQAQATAIEEEVQQARLRRPDLDRCFSEDRLDGFFVKNLESVQGDERDVMIMSVGYGPDQQGKVGLNFGPINRDGGWRRLNVAVTRARYRMEVIASFHGGSLADSANKSLQHLKRYLEYAQDGPAVLARDLVQEDAEPDSPFEESVLNVLRDWGYQVQPQVGVAGYRIDLGVRYPELPGAYALGIECDGAMYHSSKAARDRDRLREQVLTGLGWRLHRIWGTDWYRGRTEAEARLREAVQQATERGPLGTTFSARPVEDEPNGDRPTGSAVELADVPAEPGRVPVAAPERLWSATYQVYRGSVSVPYELHTPEARPALEGLLRAIVELEGPIHDELLVQRVREVWGVGRAGTRIRDNIDVVLGRLSRSGWILREEHFSTVRGSGESKARHPDGDAARKCDQIAPEERRLALRELVVECPGMSEDEVIRQACEFFGWRRVTRDTRASLESDLAALYQAGVLDHTGGVVRAL